MKRSDIHPLPPYFEKYILQVADVELALAFDDSLKQLDNLDEQMLVRLDGKRYAPDKWTVKEVIQHIIDWERILSFRTLLFARCEGVGPQAFDGDMLAANMNAEGRTIDSLLEELKLTRRSTKALFESFDDIVLQRTGMEWKYELSVLAMGFTIIGHQVHHLKIIEQQYYPLLDESL
jgi:hypothetical protein